MKCDVIDQRAAFEPTDCIICVLKDWPALGNLCRMYLLLSLTLCVIHHSLLYLYSRSLPGSQNTLSFFPAAFELRSEGAFWLKHKDTNMLLVQVQEMLCFFGCSLDLFLSIAVEARNTQQYDKRTDLFHIYHSC